MKTVQQSLSHMTAADVMSRDVRSIPQEMSLPAAARILAQDQISGAPVIDHDGHCVGVLSTTDFVRWADDGGKASLVAATVTADFCSEWEVLNVETLPRDEVRWYMSADPVMADAHTPLTHLARMMLDAHIHRVIITDPAQRPIGVVSSTDILAAVACADGPRRGE